MQHKGVYRNNRGDIFTFGSGNVWQLKGANGIDVDMDLTEGYNKVGNAVNGVSVSGGTLVIDGAFSSATVTEGKKIMSRVFAFGTTGTLTIDDTYSIDVNVKSTPAYGQNQTDSKFSLQLFAHNPFFRTTSKEFVDIGGITPEFRFPVNYSLPHRFGTRNTNKYKTFINNGTQPADIEVEFFALTSCGNFVITNLETFQKTSFEDANLESGERLVMRRNENGILEVTHYTVLEEESDALYLLDDDSNLFQLGVGENTIQGEALVNNDGLIINVQFYERQEIDV